MKKTTLLFLFISTLCTAKPETIKKIAAQVSTESLKKTFTISTVINKKRRKSDTYYEQSENMLRHFVGSDQYFLFERCSACQNLPNKRNWYF